MKFTYSMGTTTCGRAGTLKAANIQSAVKQVCSWFVLDGGRRTEVVRINARSYKITLVGPRGRIFASAFVSQAKEV